MAVLLVGIGLIAYPTVSDWWNQRHATQAVASYSEQVDSMDSAQRKQLFEEAQAYNERLAQEQAGAFSAMTSADEQLYNSLLSLEGIEVMGSLSIDSIGVSLPVYHGTDDSALQIGVGHLAGSSLPIGGESTHAVLVGHRGLPSARLLTDIDQMKEGDYFCVTTLGQELWYQVDQIRIVEPDDTSELGIVEGEDLCTLVTCTPYGINSHRLLVRGTRVDAPLLMAADAVQVDPLLVACVLAVPVLMLLVIVVLIRTSKPRNRRE